MTGGGVQVGRINQLFLLAIKQGKEKPADWAAFVWDILSAQGQRLVKDGATLETTEDNVAELTTQANTFAEKALPLLKVLRVA